MTNNLDCLEEVLMNHIYKYPICENIIRTNNSLSFEHITRLSNGVLLLIIYHYDSKAGLIIDRIFDKNKFNEVTDEYKNHPNVVNTIQLITKEMCDLQPT
jgi:hypothetical protein